MDLPVSQVPDGAGHRIIVRAGIQVGVLKSLRHQSSGLRIVPIGDDFGGIDVLVQAAVGVDLDGDRGWQVELRVERAGAVARLHAGGRRELIHVRGARVGSVEALLDTVALILHDGEGEVNFGDYACDVEALGVWNWACQLSLLLLAPIAP